MTRRIHIAEMFYDFVSELKNFNEIKQVQKAIRQIKDDPSSPSLRRHKLDKTKSDGLVSYSANKDIRIIAFEPSSEEAFLLYVDHHDVAYNWAQSKKISLDSVSGSLRVVSLSIDLQSSKVDTEETASTDYASLLPSRKNSETYLFDSLTDAEVLSEGIPESFIGLTRRIANDADCMQILDKLPTRVSEKIYSLSLTFLPSYDEIQVIKPHEIQSEESKPTFQTIESDKELDEWIGALDDALKQDFSKWRSFLHPAQRKAVNANSKGPLRILGAAGTGKTVVGIHRSLHLRHCGFENIYLLTFNRTLMRNLMDVVKDVFGSELGKTIQVNTFHQYVLDRLRVERKMTPTIGATSEQFLRPTMLFLRPKLFSTDTSDIELIFKELVDVIAAQRISNLVTYIRAPRKGAPISLNVEQKEEIWAIYEHAWNEAQKTLHIPFDLLSHFALQQNLQIHSTEAIVVDEVQDLRAADLCFLAEQAPGPNQLTLLEDAKQRIYGPGYSLKSLGINVSGKRSIKLFINYRTTDEIGKVAHNSLAELGLKATDLPLSLRHGTIPAQQHFESQSECMKFLVTELEANLAKGKQKIAILGRTREQLDTVKVHLQKLGYDYQVIERDNPFVKNEVICLATMHNCKGLEFEIVFLIDDRKNSKRKLPKWISENKVLSMDNRRRDQHLQYVALSRARDLLYVLSY